MAGRPASVDRVRSRGCINDGAGARGIARTLGVVQCLWIISVASEDRIQLL
jgi:hypothetical protein